MVKATMENSNYSNDSELEIVQTQVCVNNINVVSVMRFSFLLSVGLGIAFVVCACLFWALLNSMHVFASLEEFIGQVGSDAVSNLTQYFYFSRVLALSILVAIVNSVVLTTISVLYAYLYNLVSKLVGGIKVTISNE